MELSEDYNMYCYNEFVPILVESVIIHDSTIPDSVLQSGLGLGTGSGRFRFKQQNIAIYRI